MRKKQRKLVKSIFNALKRTEVTTMGLQNQIDQLADRLAAAEDEISRIKFGPSRIGSRLSTADPGSQSIPPTVSAFVGAAIAAEEKEKKQEYTAPKLEVLDPEDPRIVDAALRTD